MISRYSPGGSDGKECSCNAGDPGLIPASERSPEKEIATHSSILAGRIAWTEEPGGPQSMGGHKEPDTTEQLTQEVLSTLASVLNIQSWGWNSQLDLIAWIWGVISQDGRERSVGPRGLGHSFSSSFNLHFIFFNRDWTSFGVFKTCQQQKLFFHMEVSGISDPPRDDSPGEGNGTPLQYSWLGNPMDKGAWWAMVQGVAKSWTRLSDLAHTL